MSVDLLPCHMIVMCFFRFNKDMNCSVCHLGIIVGHRSHLNIDEVGY